MIRLHLLNTLMFNVFNWIIKLLAFPIIVKSFSVEDYGSYGIIGQIITSGALIGTAELYSYLRKELPGRPYDEQLSLYKSIHLPATIFVTVIIALLLAFDAERLVAKLLEKPALEGITAIALIILIPAMVVKDLMRFFISTKKIHIANIIRFCYQQLWTIVLVALYFAGVQITLNLWILVYLICALVSMVFAFYQLNFKELIKATYDRQQLKKALAFSVVILFSVILAESGNFISRYLIINIISLQALGLFYFALKLPQLVGGFSTSIINFVSKPYLIEAINKKDVERQSILGGKMLVVNLFFYVLLSLPILVNLEQIILIFGKQEYLVTAKMIMLFFVAGIFGILPVSYYTDHFAKGDKRFLLRTPSVTFVVNILGSIVLLNLFGLIGIAWGAVVQSAVHFLLCYYPLRGKGILNIPKKSLSRFGLILVVTSLLAATLYSAGSLIFNGLTFIILSSGSLLTIPVLLLFVFQVLHLDFKRRRVLVNWH